jgi:AraC family transcriptional regulator
LVDDDRSGHRRSTGFAAIAALQFVATIALRAGSGGTPRQSLFETNRAMAWRCLSDASNLLGTESDATNTPEAPAPITFKSGGLSVGQAKRALAFIEANLGSKIGIAELSALVALSKCHFCRAFKLTLGNSPMAYVSIRRIERAKLLITSTSECLSEIALACGFADQSHFNRSFSRTVGKSPGLWRRCAATPLSQKCE